MHRARSTFTSIRRRFGAGFAAAAVAVVPTAVVVTAIAASAPAGASGCTTSWSAPGTSGSLDVAKNWTAGVPTAAADACLPASATPYTVTEQVDEAAHSLVVDTGATLQLTSDAGHPGVVLTAGAGGVTNNGTVVLTNADSASHDALIASATGAFLNNGLVTLSGSCCTGINMTVTNAANGTIDVTGEAAQLRVLQNNGNLDVEAAAVLTLATLTNYSASTHTLSGGVFAIDGRLAAGNTDVRTLDAELEVGQFGSFRDLARGVSALANLATVTANGQLTVGDGANFSTGRLSNRGRVLLGTNASLTTSGTYTQTGVYTFLGTGSYLTAGGSGTVINAGDLSGEGTIASALVNNGGSIFPSYQINVQGAFTQKAAGTLSVRLTRTGTTALNVFGDSALNGTLEVDAASDLGAGRGNAFTVLNATGARTGKFKALTQSGLPGQLQFQITNAAPSVGVQVVSVFDDNSTGVSYLGWHVQLGGAGGSSFHYACDGAETASFSFVGSNVQWHTLRGPSMGIGEVLIDGHITANVDLYAAVAHAATFAYQHLGTGAHTITIETQGTKNPNASDACVVVDGFTVAKTTTDDAARALRWGSWNGVTVGTGGYYTTSIAGSTVTVQDGTSGFQWITRTGPDQGMAQIRVDGAVVKTVDLYSKTAKATVAISVPTSTDVHVITITTLATKNPASTGTNVAFDALVVFGFEVA